ncbi:kinesin light chain, partial [Phaeosphaeriaceae sp. PMI808]
MASSHKQLSCADYHVAWVCPLADVELLPARLMLDEEHPTPPYDTHYDENTYICGTINGHAVVVATCPPGGTGNVNAGRLTGPMFKTFPNIRMAVLVGIGGAIPRLTPSEDPLDDIHLGDVVVGWPGDGKPACVYHDQGRSKVDGHFELVGTMQNPDWRLLQALGILASDQEIGKTTFADQLRRLQKNKKFALKFARPSLERDRLFKATYHHIGDYGSDCAACDYKQLVQRHQRSADDAHELVFHRGRIATGNAVIQDGELRDEIGARCDGALCVEMEAAGVDINRRCLVIRGISDYADSHKADIWKPYAAGNAAAPSSFVGRETQLAQLDAHISSEGCRRLAIYGLGGCGKTALALESAYRTREQQPAHAIFWVPAVSRESFEQAYREIGALLRIPGIADDNADVKRLVKAWLSDEGFGPWLMVVDNADDFSVLRNAKSSTTPLIDYLPHSSRKGSIVFTTRTREAAVDLAGSNGVELGELSEGEGKEVLRTRLLPDDQHLLEDDQVVHEFLDMLAFLALAIVQAAAFINKNNSTLADYMSVYKDSEEDAIKLLSKEFEDHGRYRDTKNPVATTWYISFKRIQKQDLLAADYLSFMACTAGENIPGSLLLQPSSDRLAAMEAVGTLGAYAFVTERRQQLGGRDGQHRERMFDMHRLVRLAMRNWLREHRQWNAWVNKTLTRLLEVVPYGGHGRREVWIAYLPHAMHLVELPEVHEAEGRVSLLDRLGYCEQSLGRYNSAELAYRKVLERKESILGKEDPETLMSMNNVAVTLNDQGKYLEAEKMQKEVVEKRKRISGEEHPDTILAMNNLAGMLGNQGQLDEAAKISKEVVEKRKRILGKECPDTTSAMNNLAITLGNQGQLDEAAKIFKEVVEKIERILSEEHPDTTSAMNNLAITLGNQGQLDEAAKIFK